MPGESAPLPMNQREWIRLTEVPDYMMWMYNRRVSKTSGYVWRWKGMTVNNQDHLPPEQRDRVTLLASMRGGRLMVRIIDLEAFLNIT